MEEAIRFLAANDLRQPSLAETARAVHLSEHHFQRMFRRWVGISPKRFLQALTIRRAKALLLASRSLLDAAFESGLSGPGRLHDLFVTFEAMTPGEYKRRGEGLALSYGFHPSPFGTCLLAATARGVCGLAFTASEGGDGEGRDGAVESLRREFPRASLEERPSVTHPIAERIFAGHRNGTPPIPLSVRGTNFQIRVWEALLRIPEGCAISYEDLAARIGRRDAVRAVAGAVAANPVAWLIPCHRVLRKSGALGGYRWGTERKQAMLAWEAARGRGGDS